MNFRVYNNSNEIFCVIYLNFLRIIITIIVRAEMSERSNVLVSKTGEAKTSAGSNPALCAIGTETQIEYSFFFTSKITDSNGTLRKQSSGLFLVTGVIATQPPVRLRSGANPIFIFIGNKNKTY